MPFLKRRSFQLIDLFIATTVAAICAALWKFDQELGWIATSIALSAVIYYLNHVRTWPPFFVSTLVAIPIIAIALFCFALILGLRLPVFMGPAGWKRPPFQSLDERAGEALAYSMLSLFFSTLTILALGTLRRLTIIYRSSNTQRQHKVPQPTNDDNRENTWPQEIT